MNEQLFVRILKHVNLLCPNIRKLKYFVIYYLTNIIDLKILIKSHLLKSNQLSINVNTDTNG